MSIDNDEGGNCIGIFFQGDLDGIAIENNTFTHLEEGFHVLCYAGDICTGSSAPTWKNFIVRWNDFNHIHRMAMEMQPQLLPMSSSLSTRMRTPSPRRPSPWESP